MTQQSWGSLIYLTLFSSIFTSTHIPQYPFFFACSHWVVAYESVRQGYITSLRGGSFVKAPLINTEAVCPTQSLAVCELLSIPSCSQEKIVTNELLSLHYSDEDGDCSAHYSHQHPSVTTCHFQITGNFGDAVNRFSAQKQLTGEWAHYDSWFQRALFPWRKSRGYGSVPGREIYSICSHCGPGIRERKTQRRSRLNI